MTNAWCESVCVRLGGLARCTYTMTLRESGVMVESNTDNMHCSVICSVEEIISSWHHLLRGVQCFLLQLPCFDSPLCGTDI